ncbi:MAG TPA: PilZ domain-containing protein [Terracidiphilus sp.]
MDENSTWDSKWLRPNISVIEKPQSEIKAEEPAEEETPSFALRVLRWLFPEVNQRRAIRYPTPGLVAYYWTGGAPHSYHVGDMSATGLFLLTKERWAPGTLIQMTLQPQDGRQHSAEESICVLSEVVRWSQNGAGFNFVLTDYENVLNYGIMPGEATDRKSVERFLHKVAVPIGR